MEDSFPVRAHLEYVAGQSILYNNSEYEIEHVSEDGRVLYLRSENVKISHCLDTVHLRRYQVNALEEIPKRTGVLHNTKLTLKEIRLTECKANFTGETYGFYGISSDKQTLDFYHRDGVDGNPHFAHPNVREITDGRILKVELFSREQCTDGMRLLLAAVFNEFIRTIFPKTYRTIAIVPMLSEPLPFDGEHEPADEVERIKALYPYLCNPNEAFIEKNENRLCFFFINDCLEDVGAFQWFYDLSGRYMQEFLANVYSYLYWLQKRPNKEHYIYFGGSELPSCYDLEGCCNLLEGYNRVIAELGDHDIETAGEDPAGGSRECCAFCHKEMETGRYSLFDDHRFICADCFEVVDSPKQLEQLHSEMRAYLKKQYPNVLFGVSKAELDGVYDLQEGQVLSEYYYRVQFADRIIFTERDDPINNVKVSLLRGIIELWQLDAELINDYSKAQLYYEELLFLRKIKEDESANWIYNALEEPLRRKVDEIALYTGILVDMPLPETESDCTGEGDTADDGEKGKSSSSEKTSFTFMREEAVSTDEDEDENFFFEDDGHDGLYNPNKMPRFWKRYLRNLSVDDHKEEDIKDSIDDSSEDTDTDETDGTDETDNETEGTDSKTGTDKKKSGFSLFKRKSEGEKICPVEADEATNPKIRLYNELVRHAYNYSEEPIDRTGISNAELFRIYTYVCGDYPELFWCYNYQCTSNTVQHSFRCKDLNGRLDVKQIEQKRKELKKAAKYFTKGISRRTDPYKALLTVYRRLILVTDYDSVGLRNRIDRDQSKDDQLRSLYSALVKHKAVCAGYAVAMQYLMQSIGIVSAYTVSEADGNDISHAFNILKLGRQCYYLDATWGDASNTLTGTRNQNQILYDYFCVPYAEFIQTSPSSEQWHVPRKEYYPRLEQFSYKSHEYFRYHEAYLDCYDEDGIVNAIARAAKDYDAKEMGEFRVGLRFPTKGYADAAKEILLSAGTLDRLTKSAQEQLKKDYQKALINDAKSITGSACGVLYINFQ